MFVFRVGMPRTLGVACFEDLGLVGLGLNLSRAEVVALKSTRLDLVAPHCSNCSSYNQAPATTDFGSRVQGS